MCNHAILRFLKGCSFYLLPLWLISGRAGTPGHTALCLVPGPGAALSAYKQGASSVSRVQITSEAEEFNKARATGRTEEEETFLAKVKRGRHENPGVLPRIGSSRRRRPVQQQAPPPPPLPCPNQSCRARRGQRRRRRRMGAPGDSNRRAAAGEVVAVLRQLRRVHQVGAGAVPVPGRGAPRVPPGVQGLRQVQPQRRPAGLPVHGPRP